MSMKAKASYWQHALTYGEADEVALEEGSAANMGSGKERALLADLRVVVARRFSVGLQV